MEIFDTLTLAGVRQVQQVLPQYWLDLLYPQTMTFDSEQIFFDQVKTRRRMAPFVAPNVQGKVQKTQGFNTVTFKPAYVKPKSVINPEQTIKRLAGEAPLGTLSREQRFDIVVANAVKEHQDQIRRRWEWMAARAAIDSSVTVSGENYPTVTVDFQRDASLSAILVGTAKWDAVATATPLDDLEDMRRKVNKLAKSSITRLTFGLDAWAAFTKNQAVRDLLDNTKRGSQTEFNRAIAEGTPEEYRGSIEGQNGMGKLELWTYDDSYEDDNGAEQPFMDSGTVVGTGPGFAGVRCFGAIQDISAGLAALEIFQKMYDEQDPSVRYLLSQSAPLMIPGEPNASFKLKVV